MTRKLILLILVCALSLAAADKGGKWIKMFDGKTLKDWKAVDNPESWTVQDGALVGKGPRSHLFYTKEQCENCEFIAEIKLAKGSNSGMYFRAVMEPGFPKGYEAQVNNSGKDPIRTGSLYKFANVTEQLIPDDTWWTQHIIADGNHIIIKVNDKTVVDFRDEKNTYTKGYLALQQHDPQSMVMYRNLRMRKLPATSGK